MPLPNAVTRGVTTGHLAHHAELHASHAGGLPASPAEGSVGHLAGHTALQDWAAAADVAVPTVTDAVSHELAHEALHGWRNATVPPGGSVPKPSVATTGPRIPLTRTLTGAEALAELRANKVLSGATITSTITVTGSASTQDNWLLEDCKVLASGTYGIMSQSFTASSPETRPKVRYCEIVGVGVNPTAAAASAVVNLAHTVLEYCEMYGCADGAKLWDRAELYACYIHDLWHNGKPAPDNSHSDAIQIQSGDDISVRWNNLSAVIAYQPSAATEIKVGDGGSGVLQTGSLNGDIRRQVWHDNWMDGATIICRMGDTGYPTPNANGYVIDSQYRRNKFGRNGVSTDGGRSGTNNQSSLGGVRFDTSNVYEDTGLPV